MSDFAQYFQDFFIEVGNDAVEIYNEFSLQHELGIYLRMRVGAQFRVQFERPVTFFDISEAPLEKREIDISVIAANQSAKYAIELKFPRNGQYPEQMFKACQDIRFLEQLHQHGFEKCYFIMAVDDPNFYIQVDKADGIYAHFRSGKPIHGSVQKPTGKKDHVFEILGSYQIKWRRVTAQLRYAFVEVGA